MAHWLRLDTVDEDDGETREVEAQQSLGDESPLEFERGYASVEDEETADDLARRYVHIERATPPEWADDQPEEEPLTAEQQAERRDDLDPSDVGKGGGGQDAEGEQTHADQRNMADDTTNETEDAEAQTQDETDGQTQGQDADRQADGQVETQDVTDQPADQQADGQEAEAEQTEGEEQSVTDPDRLGDMTVDELEAELNSGEYDDQLAEIEEAERQGKDRKGVHDAVDQRRSEGAAE